jgi:plasmid segregation protein ParM
MDIGFGNTKVLVGYEEDGTPNFFHFPSLAPKSARTLTGESFGDTRDTVVVEVNGLTYEVGPDSVDLASNAESRILHDQYVHSDQYMAIYLGGLYYMDTDVIDYIQLGLPFNMMHNADLVKKRAIGEFKVGDRTITVKNAGVIEQPLGGYEFHCAYAADGEDMEDETVLLIDPGYYTFDWVVVRNGKLVEPRSGAVQGGVSRVLSMLAKGISEQYLNGADYTNLEAIDRALMKEKRQIRIYGQKCDLSPLLSYTTPAIDGPINQMIGKVGDMKDIDRVVLISGGARLFKKRLTHLMPKFELEIPENGVFANVLGYQERAFKDLGLK